MLPQHTAVKRTIIPCLLLGVFSATVWVSVVNAEGTAKLAVPTQPALQQAQQQMRSSFAAKLRSARTLRQRSSLSQFLLDRAENEEQPALAYVLFQSSREQAVGSRNATLALKAIESCGTRFDVDGLEIAGEAISAILSSARTDEQRRDAIDSAVQLAQRASAHKRFEIAAGLTDRASELARRTRDPSRIKSADAARTVARTMRARWKRLDAAMTMLESDPDEPNANYVVGLQCFQEQRWNDGVRHLARAANHAAVASVAAGDLRGAVGPASFIALAEDWKRVAQSSSELTPLLHRSLYWMHRAIPKKEGEERRALESEVAAIRKELVRWSSQPAIPTAQTRQREPGKNAASNVTMKAAGQRIHTFSAHPGGRRSLRNGQAGHISRTHDGLERRCVFR